MEKWSRSRYSANREVAKRFTTFRVMSYLKAYYLNKRSHLSGIMTFVRFITMRASWLIQRIGQIAVWTYDKPLNPQHFFPNLSAGFSALVILVFLPILFFPTHNHRLLENSLRFFSDSKYRTLFSKSSIRFCRPPNNKIRVLTSSLSETGKLYGKGGSLGSGILNRATPLFRSYLTHHTCVHTKHTQE